MTRGTRFVASLSELCASRRKVRPCYSRTNEPPPSTSSGGGITRVTSLLRGHVPTKLVYLCNSLVIGGSRYLRVSLKLIGRFEPVNLAFFARFLLAVLLHDLAPIWIVRRVPFATFWSSVQFRKCSRRVNDIVGASLRSGQVSRRQVSKGRKRQLLRWRANGKGIKGASLEWQSWRSRGLQTHRGYRRNNHEKRYRCWQQPALRLL